VVRRFAQVSDDLALARNDLQRRLENLAVVQRQRLADRPNLGLLAPFLTRLLFRNIIFIGQADASRFFPQVGHVGGRSFYELNASPILVYGFRLCWRLHNYQRTSHVAVLPRNLLREGPQPQAVSFSLPYITELSSGNRLRLS